jgi:hypothetical protein
MTPDEPPPRLLVSVRSLAEAREAVLGGADLVDLKEPLRGPLGAVDPETAREVVEGLGGVRPITAAWGELNHPAGWDEFPEGIGVVKVGMASAGADWERRLERLRDQLPRGVGLAVAAYADPASGSPPPLEVARALGDLGVGWLVIDTADKRGPSTLDLLGGTPLQDVFGAAEVSNAGVVLAGSIPRDRIAEAALLRPAVVGVRGAACLGGREGVVDAKLVAKLRGRITAAVAPRSLLAAGKPVTMHR